MGLSFKKRNVISWKLVRGAGGRKGNRVPKPRGWGACTAIFQASWLAWGRNCVCQDPPSPCSASAKHQSSCAVNLPARRSRPWWEKLWQDYPFERRSRVVDHGMESIEAMRSQVARQRCDTDLTATFDGESKAMRRSAFGDQEWQISSQILPRSIRIG